MITNEDILVAVLKVRLMLERLESRLGPSFPTLEQRQAFDGPGADTGGSRSSSTGASTPGAAPAAPPLSP